ncbi:helix-turn-helix domain-containing protein [Amphibacillus sp. Q70]|uniref:helix-turn-helix domain-containing protein n=1 Tax=Amphibacillus sp. Q70 TaxID=3453416 RepID=UPI003F82E70E
MFNYLILLAVSSVKGQRSTASIYHIFSGRRSAQTIQDAHIYQLTNLYAIYNQLKRREFEQVLAHLIEQNYLRIDDQNHAELTKMGELYLNEHKDDHPIQAFKGIDYVNKTGPFMARLLLTLQTYSNLSMNHKQFQPIIDSSVIQKWVKQYYQHNQDTINWLSKVHGHLAKFLATIDEQQAQIFVERLTGYQRFGLTIQQVAIKYNLSIHDVYLLLTASYHQLISFIEMNQINPLFKFIPNREQQQIKSTVTQSAEKTYQLILQGYSVEQIMKRRRLKRSTIEDHIVELTYSIPEFNIAPFIEPEAFKYILAKINQVEDHRLSTIKQLLGDHYSYFQIRLTMARARLVKL